MFNASPMYSMLSSCLYLYKLRFSILFNDTGKCCNVNVNLAPTLTECDLRGQPRLETRTLSRDSDANFAIETPAYGDR